MKSHLYITKIQKEHKYFVRRGWLFSKKKKYMQTHFIKLVSNIQPQSCTALSWPPSQQTSLTASVSLAQRKSSSLKTELQTSPVLYRQNLPKDCTQSCT